MTGKRLKEFAANLPDDEKSALQALCEPEWKQEVLFLKKGNAGIMMPVAFTSGVYNCVPLYSDGKIRWLKDLSWLTDEQLLSPAYQNMKRFPEDEEIISEYRNIEPKYESEMQPYRWQYDLFTGKITNPHVWFAKWLEEHNPEIDQLSEDDLIEREQVIASMKQFFGEDACNRILRHQKQM